jgi:hypothetical protein
LRDVGVYDDYAERNNLKEKQLKELVNKEYDVDRATMDYYCGTSEDYERNQEQCDKLYDMLEEEKEIKNNVTNSMICLKRKKK